MEQHQQNDVVWGNVIMLLVLLPNLVFIIWFGLAHRKSLGSKDTWMKITIYGMVQMFTFIRYFVDIKSKLNE